MALRQIPAHPNEEPYCSHYVTRHSSSFRLGFACLVALFFFQPVLAQEPETSPSPSQSSVQTSFATVRGIVQTVAGEPLPRALVSIEGDAEAGVLTDSQGRFEIPNVPTGPQIFQVRKPGFFDHASSLPAEFSDDPSNISHNVVVADGMADLRFTMSPYCGIRGQIDLSTGDPAEGIAVQLLHRAVEDGRPTWQIAANTKTNRDGAYHFGNLLDGVYVVSTQPALDSEPASSLAAPGIDRQGYAAVYYPGTRNRSDAANIHLAGGDHAQANFILTLEPFYSISGVASLPSLAITHQQGPAQFNATVLDSHSNPIPYWVRLDPQTGAFQTALPDGSYTLFVTGGPAVYRQFIRTSDRSLDPATIPTVFSGAVDIVVAGRAVSGLRIPLTQVPSGNVNLTLARTASPESAVPEGHGAISVLADPAADAIGKFSFFAVEMAPGPNPTMALQPGSYWFRSDADGQNLCEQSFTANGASLARQPLVVGISAPAPPMELVLRNDCAKLTLSLPIPITALLAGEEPSYQVMVVPDFDSTQLVQVHTMRPSSGSVTVEDLTPGSYHVYLFDGPVHIEYRNPAVLAALSNPGQQVTLSEGAAANLMLEVPQK
jgi:hypothetical protein